MFKVLEHFNFGESLITWIKLFYKGANRCVTNNGHLSSFFEIQRGVRQGCPLSPILFIMCIELLSYEVSNNQDIKGIKICDQEVKNTLFADDATFITDGTNKSFKTLVDVLDNFSFLSGLKLNTKKCNVLRAGSLKSTPIELCKSKKFHWKSDYAKALGMVFYNDVIKTSKHNLEIKIEDFKKCLKQWQHRKLTLMGKITVVKSFAFPKLVYPLTVLNNISKESIKQIINLMFQFIWDRKPDKIKRNILCQDYSEGGLKMLDLNKFILSLKASWISRILDKQNQGQWKKIYLHKLKMYGGELIFECKLNKKDIDSMFTEGSFLSDVLSAWYDINKLELDVKDPSNTIIWNNSEIKIANKPYFYQSWYNRGIKYLKDIYDMETKRFHTFINLIDRFNIPRSDFLKYMSLTSSIPFSLKQKLENEVHVNVINNNHSYSLLSKLLKSKEKNKYLYRHQMKNKIEHNISSQDKWETFLEKENIQWDKIYSNIYTSTIDIKLRNFQYKYLFRIVPTNKRLFKQNISSSNLCDFCNMNVETIQHLFWECNQVQIFWNSFKNFVTNAHIPMQLTFETVSFGFCENTNEDKLKNYILFYAKYYIFLNKCHKTIPSCEMFKPYLKQKINIEKELALMNDKLQKFELKWRQFIATF